MDEGAQQNRSRVVVAIVLGCGLLAAVLIVILAGGGGESEAAAADPECVEQWNDDEAIVAYGIHQFNGHGYERVQVLRITREAKPTDSESGLCAVVFAAQNLDPEPGARAQVLLDGKWTGIENLGNVDEQEIARLQTDAFGEVNASLTTDGRIAPNDGEG